MTGCPWGQNKQVSSNESLPTGKDKFSETTGKRGCYARVPSPLTASSPTASAHPYAAAVYALP